MELSCHNEDLHILVGKVEWSWLDSKKSKILELAQSTKLNLCTTVQ